MASMEIIRTERRRRYSEVEKSALLTEVDAGGCTIAEVDWRHGMAESLLYNWRANRRSQVAFAVAPRLTTGPEYPSRVSMRHSGA